MAERSRRLPLAIPAVRLDKLPAGTLPLARDGALLVFAMLIGLLAAWIFVKGPTNLRPTFDDSYISLIFARNLAEHAKLSYDGISWSTGATSPLHVILLAVPLKLGFDPVVSSVALGVVCNAFLAGAVYLLGLSIFHSRLAGVLGALAIAFTCYTPLDAGNGLETTLFMTLVALTMASYFFWSDTRGRAVTGLLVALAVLTRPEGAFLAPALVVYRWFDRPRFEPRERYFRDALLLAAPAVAAIGALVLYSLAVNGTLAGTASAKLQFFRENEQPLRVRVSLGGDYVGLYSGPLITQIAVAALVVRRRESLLFALFWLPVIVFYVLLFSGGMFHYFYRYQHPVLPMMAALAGGGAAYLLWLAASNGFLIKVLVVAGLVIVIVPIWQQYERWRVIYVNTVAENYNDLEPMARDLNNIIEPGQVLATHDIGAVGYYGRFQVLDLVGLVNPKVLPYHKNRRLKEYVEGAHPDYLLIFADWDAAYLNIFPEQDPARYQLVKSYRGGFFRKSSYLLYKVNHP